MLRYWFVPFVAWLGFFMLFWNVGRWRKSVALTVLRSLVWAAIAAAVVAVLGYSFARILD